MPRTFTHIVLALVLGGATAYTRNARCFSDMCPGFSEQHERAAWQSDWCPDAASDSSRVSLILADVQQGIQTEDIALFLRHFAVQVYVNLRNVESGYYSANQAQYVMKNFFGSRRVMSFKLSTTNEDETAPYATGAGLFMHRGRRETLQVYVGLSKVGHQWLISQFNVY